MGPNILHKIRAGGWSVGEGQKVRQERYVIFIDNLMLRLHVRYGNICLHSGQCGSRIIRSQGHTHGRNRLRTCLGFRDIKHSAPL